MGKREIKTVLATVSYTGWHWDRLSEALAPAKIIRANIKDREAVSEALKEADVAILGGDVNDQIVAEGKNLKWIHCDHAGLNASARPEIFERGILLTGSAGRSAPALAQHAFFLILSLVYDSHALMRQQEKHIWGGIPGYDDRRGVYDKTIGILGMGNTGREVAKLAKAFHMHMLGYTRTVGEMPEGMDEMFYTDRGDSLDELLRRCDFLVLAMRLTNQTYHIIDERAFSLMKDSAYLINMARGSLVDEAALYRALQNGTIAGAGCDTFETEPLSPDSPLWDLPNMIVTPHSTPQMPDRTAQSLEIICENIRHYREGKPMRNQMEARDVYTET